MLAAHLGHGASLCAIQDGRSVATTMGFTTFDGLMMGTRCGAVDPGLVLHLIRERGLTPDAVAELLNERSGLLGVSGIGDDVRDLEGSGAPHAREALDLFSYRVVREAGSLIAALGGLVFTGGVGEHTANVRAGICRGFAFDGVALDATANGQRKSSVGAPSSPVAIRIVPAEGEREIALSVAGPARRELSRQDGLDLPQGCDCGPQPQSRPVLTNIQEDAMTDVLVVYYSRTGTTETVARALAARLGAEIDSIEALTTYVGTLGFVKGIWHSIRDATPPIRRRLDPRRFRAVILCSPVWAGKLAGPARTYLGQAGQVPFLCGVAVSGSGGPQARFFRELERLGGRDGIPTLSLAQCQVRDGAFERLLDSFIETVRTRHIEAA